jgi:hypothetical protein
MTRLIALLLLLACPLAAAYESNFGRVILSQSDVIVQGVAAAKRTKLRASVRVELTIETVLHGKEAATDVSVYYTDPDSLGEDAVRGLFALKALADGGYTLVGKPVLTPAGDAEEADKLAVVREFIALEAQPEGDERTTDFWALIVGHINLGGYAAQNAAVELMYVARDRGEIITEKRFDEVVTARDAATSRLTKQTREDMRLACQGLVEAKVKSLKFKRVRREVKAVDKRAAANELVLLQKDFPRAFVEDDAKLCEALQAASEDKRLNETLADLAREIRAAIRAREQEERDKAAEARKKIEHAGG